LATLTPLLPDRERQVLCACEASCLASLPSRLVTRSGAVPNECSGCRASERLLSGAGVQQLELAALLLGAPAQPLERVDIETGVVAACFE
jgi:hypothetical protein